MVTDRPYRGRMPGDEAVERLLEAAGTQFDPAVVSAFIRLFQSGEVLPAE
jgi:HD-GYP domain-containing protein (c-di-GMP phosphodiesterase class II)